MTMGFIDVVVGAVTSSLNTLVNYADTTCLNLGKKKAWKLLKLFFKLV